MPRQSLGRLAREDDFRRVFRKGSRATTPLLVLHFLPNGLERIRVGIIVSRRFGGAVRRNRLRRRLREAVRAQGWRRGAGFDLVVAPRERAAGASFAEMRDAMAAVLRGAGLVATGDLT